MTTTLPAADLFEQADLILQDCLWVPNELLPARYHDNREGGRSLSRVDKIYKRDVAKRVAHAELKAEKARRIAVLAAQHEAGCDALAYNEDHDRLYRNQIAFVGGMIAGGVIDADDLLED